MLYTTERANDYIFRGENTGSERFIPVYHFTPPKGWMNDPNGLIYYGGKYHVFYQYYPYDTQWGPMHWGHACSDDLVAFEHMPVALAPDGERESGCFSGGAVVSKDGEELCALYTRHYVDGDTVTQTQYLAASRDGVCFQKSQNAVIDSDCLPKGSSRKDFRDPNPVLIDGKYYAVVGNCNGGRGQIQMFVSDDMRRFDYFMTVEHESFGNMVECPDLFPLGDKFVLVYSVIGLKSDTLTNIDGKACLYAVGTLDFSSRKFIFEHIDSLDEGTDFYAPQTLSDEKGRRILIGWMDMWNNNPYLREIGHRSVGKCTLPRELLLDGNRLLQRPIEEVFGYLGKELPVTKGARLERNFCLRATFAQGERLRFGSDEEFTEVGVRQGRLYLKTHQFHHISCERLGKQVRDRFEVTLFSDRGSLEVFDGTDVITVQFLADGETFTVEECNLNAAKAYVVNGKRS